MACSQKDAVLKPLKIGVRLEPAALTLIYEEERKRRIRVMPVRNLSSYGPISLPLSELKKRHTKYIQNVPDIRLEKMLRLLQEVSKGSPLQDALKTLAPEFNIDPNQDLNKVTEDILKKKKKIMESSFSEHQIVPGDSDYEYDKRVDFENALETAGWDSGDDSTQFWD